MVGSPGLAAIAEPVAVSVWFPICTHDPGPACEETVMMDASPSRSALPNPLIGMVPTAGSFSHHRSQTHARYMVGTSRYIQRLRHEPAEW